SAARRCAAARAGGTRGRMRNEMRLPIQNGSPGNMSRDESRVPWSVRCAVAALAAGLSDAKMLALLVVPITGFVSAQLAVWLVSLVARSASRLRPVVIALGSIVGVALGA